MRVTKLAAPTAVGLVMVCWAAALALRAAWWAARVAAELTGLLIRPTEDVYTVLCVDRQQEDYCFSSLQHTTVWRVMFKTGVLR